MQTLEDVLGSRINLTVLRYLMVTRGGMSGNQIAGRLGLQQTSVRLALERLVKTGVVTRRDVGRSAAYEMDEDLVFVRTVLVPLFRAESHLRNRLMNSLVQGSRKLVPPPTAVVLFGSAARGERNFRDVDLLCVVVRDNDKLPLQDRVAGAYGQVQKEFNVPVSALVATDTELRTPRLEALRQEVRRDGVLLCGTVPEALHGISTWEGSAE
jgi:predicted nucleotidyltransferase